MPTLAYNARMNAERDALEAGLLADPDHLAAHYAHADWLIEHDDPLGEYFRAMLEREEGGHGLRYLGEEMPQDAALILNGIELLLGPLLLYFGDDETPYKLSPKLKRGWIDTLYFNDAMPNMMDVMTEARGLLLLTEVTCFGCGDRAVYERLNPCRYGNLRMLDIFDPIFNDDDLTMLTRQGLPPRLEKLILEHGVLTDDSAERLAALKRAHPALAIRLRGNVFSPLGRAILAEVGIDCGDQRFDESTGRVEEWI